MVSYWTKLDRGSSRFSVDTSMVAVVVSVARGGAQGFPGNIFARWRSSIFIVAQLGRDTIGVDHRACCLSRQHAFSASITMGLVRKGPAAPGKRPCRPISMMGIAVNPPLAKPLGVSRFVLMLSALLRAPFWVRAFLRADCAGSVDPIPVALRRRQLGRGAGGLGISYRVPPWTGPPHDS